MQVSDSAHPPLTTCMALLFRARVTWPCPPKQKGQGRFHSENLPCPILLASLLSTGYQCRFIAMIGAGSSQARDYFLLCYKQAVGICTLHDGIAIVRLLRYELVQNCRTRLYVPSTANRPSIALCVYLFRRACCELPRRVRHKYSTTAGE